MELWYKNIHLSTIKEVRIRTRRADPNEVSLQLQDNQIPIIVDFQGVHTCSLKFDRVILRADDDYLESRLAEPDHGDPEDTITIHRLCIITKEEDAQS